MPCDDFFFTKTFGNQSCFKFCEVSLGFSCSGSSKFRNQFFFQAGLNNKSQRLYLNPNSGKKNFCSTSYNRQGANRITSACRIKAWRQFRRTHFTAARHFMLIWPWFDTILQGIYWRKMAQSLWFDSQINRLWS